MKIKTEWNGKVWIVYAFVRGESQMYMAKSLCAADRLFARDLAGELFA